MIYLTLIRTEKLDEAIAQFEKLYGSINSVCGKFVTRLAIWILESLERPELFIEDAVNNPSLADIPGDRARVLVELYRQLDFPNDLRALFDVLESELHPVKDDDQIDQLIVQVIHAVVKSES